MKRGKQEGKQLFHLSRENDFAIGKLPSVDGQSSRAPTEANPSQSLQSHLNYSRRNPLSVTLGLGLISPLVFHHSAQRLKLLLHLSLSLSLSLSYMHVIKGKEDEKVINKSRGLDCCSDCQV